MFVAVKPSSPGACLYQSAGTPLHGCLSGEQTQTQNKNKNKVTKTGRFIEFARLQVLLGYKYLVRISLRLGRRGFVGVARNGGGCRPEHLRLVVFLLPARLRRRPEGLPGAQVREVALRSNDHLVQVQLHRKMGVTKKTRKNEQEEEEDRGGHAALDGLPHTPSSIKPALDPACSMPGIFVWIVQCVCVCCVVRVDHPRIRVQQGSMRWYTITACWTFGRRRSGLLDHFTFLPSRTMFTAASIPQWLHPIPTLAVATVLFFHPGHDSGTDTFYTQLADVSSEFGGTYTVRKLSRFSRQKTAAKITTKQSVSGGNRSPFLRGGLVVTLDVVWYRTSPDIVFLFL